MSADAVAAFGASFAALYAAHQVADHWVQTGWQAANKGRRDHTGRRACAAHVVTYTVTQAAFLAAMGVVTGLRAGAVLVWLALGVSAASHYWADRRSTLAALAERCGKADFYRLGAPRDAAVVASLPSFAEDPYLAPIDAPTLGTGAYALDQSWHIGWLFVAALIIAGGAS